MVISIASQKGGTGKTSTSISLTAGLARAGKKVLLIDIDSQANSSKVVSVQSWQTASTNGASGGGNMVDLVIRARNDFS